MGSATLVGTSVMPMRTFVNPCLKHSRMSAYPGLKTPSTRPASISLRALLIAMWPAPQRCTSFMMAFSCIKACSPRRWHSWMVLITSTSLVANSLMASKVTPSRGANCTVKPKGHLGRRKTTAHYICEVTDGGAHGGSVHFETAGDGNIDCIHTKQPWSCTRAVASSILLATGTNSLYSIIPIFNLF